MSKDEETRGTYKTMRQYPQDVYILAKTSSVDSTFVQRPKKTKEYCVVDFSILLPRL